MTTLVYNFLLSKLVFLTVKIMCVVDLVTFFIHIFLPKDLLFLTAALSVLVFSMANS